MSSEITCNLVHKVFSFALGNECQEDQPLTDWVEN